MPLDYDWQPPSAEASHCCAAMAASLDMSCEQHNDPFECPDVALVHHEIFGEYGIPIRDGGAGYLLISHCPWCGSALPEGGRDRWFDAIEAAGLADTPTAELPEHFRSSAWRRRAAN
ncbi:MAG: hypothetical protein SFW09_17015 [Hyphomicrobiaceae bacterium]|nr:hypothetical protein [Hyphomicrobiaceae bacterium]